jgi:transcriptional regulator with XRE-family HTH domain
MSSQRRDNTESGSDPRHVLKIARTAASQTQTDLARKTGIDPGDVSRYETGSRKITRSVAARFGEALFADEDE